MGSGSKIRKIDEDPQIIPFSCSTVKKVFKLLSIQKVLLTTSKFDTSHVSKLTVDPPTIKLVISSILGQTFFFKAVVGQDGEATPYLIKKTKKTKGAGPMW